MKNRIKSGLLNIPGFQALCRHLTRGHVRTLMYHRFSSEGSPHPRRLPINEFAWQMMYLKKHHLVVSPDDQLPDSQQQFSKPDRPRVVITVDDGYSDFAMLAFPLLQRHNLPATVFITSGFVAGQTWFWWDRLTWLLENCAPGGQVFQFAGMQTQGNPSDEEQRWKLWHTIADHLSIIDDDIKEAALADLAAGAGLNIPTSPPEAYEALTWDQVREMGRSGINFGAHTVNHPVLSRVDAIRAEKEIRESGSQLANETGSFPGWFCYPQGQRDDFRPDTVEQVEQAGFRGCYTSYPDPHHEGDPMTLPRYSISEDRLAFQWILCGAEHLFMYWKTRNDNRKDES